MITLHNTFHNTRTKIRSLEGADTVQDYLFRLEQIKNDRYWHNKKESDRAARKLKRIKDTLCGSKECRCSPFIQIE